MRNRSLLPTLLSCALTALSGSGCAAAQGPAPASDTTFPTEWPFRAASVPVTESREGLTATTDPVASEIGDSILRRGGNAVDAAVATHFALAVVNPEAGNIGGGGFMVVRMADGTTAALDFREAAPLGATRDMFLDARGQPTDRSVLGHLASGVPGSVAGMWEAHRRFGSLPWADLLQPAIDLADGMVVKERLARSLKTYETRLRRFPATAAIFVPEGHAPALGERLAQPDLAATLRRIAKDGKAGFYSGRTAELVEAEMRRGGGLITRADLALYEAKWRDPIVFDYRGHTIISMPPPSSGGATLAEMLNILEGYDLGTMGHHSAREAHLFAEASSRAFADRNAYLADPDFVQQPVRRMISDEYATVRRADIRPDRATPSTAVAPGLGPVPGGVPAAPIAEPVHTTHYSIVDRAGNAVAVTTTLNSLYGSLVTVAGAGFLLNNEMDDFTSRPGVPNQYGLVQGAANAIQPGKRMLSAMTPTILLDRAGRLQMVTGSPGGPTIISTVAEMVLNVVDFGMSAAQATAAPRLHDQHLPDRLLYEHRGLSPEVVSALRALGHTVEERSGFQGDAQSILVRPDGERVRAGDPRRSFEF
jgi:gamma-glutamyltranspeptidase/glutathione hydrolase